MMFSIYRSEMLKLRHTKLSWAVVITAVMGNLVSLVMLLPKVTLSGEAAAVDMQEVFYRQGNMVTILGPFMFALMAGYLFSREYSDRTVNQLFTYPVSRVRIFFAKMGVMFTLVVLTSALSCLAALTAGLVMVASGEAECALLMKGMAMNLAVCVLSFGTIPVAAAAGIVGKSVIPPMVLGAFASLVTLVLEIGHGMKAVLFPWATPYYLVRELGQGFAETGANPYAGTAFVILAAVFVAGAVFCLWQYTRSEIHSGS